jgi:hypothetical protein
MGQDAFDHCSSLSYICIPFSLTRICQSPFHNCSALTAVHFESGSELSYIEDCAFLECSSLSSICLPPRLPELDAAAFLHTNLHRISIAPGNRHLKVCGDFILDFEGVSIKLYFGKDTEGTIPKNITVLPANCFAYRATISRVIFESGSRLSRIEKSAFSQCESLSSICIPASVETICEGCFYACRSLSVVTFEANSNLCRIEKEAFSRCRSLSSICIPSRVASLSEDVFFGCGSLSALTFEPGSKLSYRKDHFLGSWDLLDLDEPVTFADLEVLHDSEEDPEEGLESPAKS